MPICSLSHSNVLWRSQNIINHDGIVDSLTLVEHFLKVDIESEKSSIFINLLQRSYRIWNAEYFKVWLTTIPITKKHIEKKVFGIVVPKIDVAMAKFSFEQAFWQLKLIVCYLSFNFFIILVLLAHLIASIPISIWICEYIG